MARRLRHAAYAQPSWRQRHPALPWLLLLAPLALYLILFFLQPIVLFFGRSFGFPHPSLKAYGQALGTATYLKIIWQTLRLSGIVALCCTILGYPLAFCMTAASPRWRGLLWAAVLLPLWTNVLVRSYAWIVILRVHGVLDSVLGTLNMPWRPSLLYNEAGVVIGMVQVLLPYMVLTLYGVMREIDMRAVRAAASLGAPPFVQFRRVYLPLSMPGVTSGFLITFLLAIGFYITPALLGGGKVLMISLQIEQQIDELVNWQFGAALSVILVVVVAVLVILFVRLFGARLFGLGGRERRQVAEAGESGTQTAPAWAFAAAQPDRLRVGTQRRTRTYARPPMRWRWWATVGVAVAVCLFLVVPVFIVAAMSFSATSYLAFPPRGFSLRWYAAFFHGEEWMQAAWVSVQAAALTAIFSLVLGTSGALVFVRGQFPGKTAAYVAALLPLIVPVIVTAVAIYSLFARLHLIGNVWGFAIADTVLAVPSVVLIVSAALSGVDVALERAAMILGASRLRALYEITLPLVAPALAAGALFGFVTSFDESVITLFLSSITTATLPKVMWDSLRFEIDPTISAISALLVALSILALGLSAALLGRRGARSATLAG